MTQTMQDQFEQAFSDDNGKLPVAFIKLQRLGDSYSVPRVARAWYWFKRSRETLVVELPKPPDLEAHPVADIEYLKDVGYGYALAEARKAIHAAGIKTTP